MHLRDVKSALALATTASLLSVAASPVLAAPSATSVTFASQNGSGETGSATLTAVGSKTMVVLKIAGAPDTAQPAHIHLGTCAKLNPKPSYPLTDVVAGKSTTTVPVPLSKLLAGTYAINIHKSMADVGTYVACGDIKSAMKGAMTGGAAGGAPSGSASMGGGSMSGGSAMGTNTPAPAADPSAAASPQGPGSGGGSQVGPLPTPATTQGPESQASHSP